ncbi:MAG: GNAT family N-acetyltransferase [Turicibacter sp.]
MIRPYQLEDEQALSQLLKASNRDLANEVLENRSEEHDILILDAEVIQGYAILKERRCNQGIEIDLYVSPECRGQGYGTQLYKELLTIASNKESHVVIASVINEKQESKVFLNQQNFSYWFGYHEMIYKGTHQPESNLPFIRYSDSYFEKYVALLAEGFYELREANQIHPFICCQPSDEFRKMLSQKQTSIYLLLDETDEIISTFNVSHGHLDDIVVNKRYQNQGYGRKTTQAAINMARAQQPKEITLDVVCWNQTAYNLYASLGFEVTRTVELYRKKIKN